jgi:CRISPR-associated endonuclease/helicase Cas3
MLWAIRAALIAADSAGSGLPREGKDIVPWVREAFFEPLATGDTPDGRMTQATVEQSIIRPRMDRAGISEDRLNAFQRAVGDPEKVPERALLLAPCGSGKTLAAWKWVAARCAERARRRAIFLYPTRGTATEGYRDYVSLAGPEAAALVHGTADLDLDGIHPDVRDENRINEARLYALRQWPKRLFSATVDQFIGFLQHAYGPTCHLPLLADSVVVCDEVHSYDRGMFSALIEFLRHFDVPVLCMTATMLQGRRQQLLKGGEDLGENGLVEVNGLEIGGAAEGESELRRAAEHPRYRVRRVGDEKSACEIVNAALAANKRILWVVNTVDRCQRIARELAQDVEATKLSTKDCLPLFCYHSRFRLKDRKFWHEVVVEAFKPIGRGGSLRGVLAVTTQVCEMSLDLDADVLVSEICPGTALVQRMGRCCRDPKAHASGRTAEVIVYEPPGDDARARRAPYTTQDMDGVDEFVRKLVSESPISQAKLEEFLLDLPTPPELPKACRFIESGPWAASGEEQFRDSDDLTRPAVLSNPVAGEAEADDDLYARIRNSKTRGGHKPWEADALVINVPKSKGGMPHVQPHGRHDLPEWLYLAINGTYFKAIGFCCGLTPTVRIA